MHRFKLCLYGNDELFIRNTAAKLGCTISHLVRMALEWYLTELINDKGKFENAAFVCHFYWNGIKRYFDVDLPIKFKKRTWNIQFSAYSEHDYW